MSACGPCMTYVGYDSYDLSKTINGDVSEVLTINLNSAVRNIIQTEEEF